jgi:eukaryotic-like serine/threonine-protein kinase
MTAISDRLESALSDRYRIERQLGAGGMATVYLAEDLKHDRKVAIKVLKPELAAVLGADRFVVEIKTTAALSHPHILPLFDSGTADGFLYYVMPFIKGETIREKLNRETQFGVDDAVRVAREVADALDYAHRNGVIHRDIKPENILLHDGRAMVMDFGIALAVSAAAGGRMTETGLSLGTPHYMSPEQATADKEISGRSDVYSLASVLYEMLSGQPPHVGGSAQQVIMKVIAESAQPVTVLRRSVPPNVAAALSRALEKLPADRFETAKMFADALTNSAFTSTSLAASAAMGAQRRGVPVPIFASVTAIAAIATGVAIWGATRPEPVRQFRRFTISFPDSQSLEQAPNFTRVAISPDGRTLAYVGRGEQASSFRLWVRPLDQLHANPLPRTESGGNPAFSPDGRQLAFVSETPRALKVVPLGGGPVVVLADSAVDIGGVTWASDGYIYYDGKLSGDGLARIRATGGKPEIATTPDRAAGELWHARPSALPEGRGVLFTVARGGGVEQTDIAVLDSRTGRHAVLVRGLVARFVASGHLLYVTWDGALMAVPFNLDQLAIVGQAVAIAEGLSTRGNVGRGATFSVSDDGLMVYVSGERVNAERELVWVSRDGQAIPVDSTWRMRLAGRPVLSPDGRRVAVTITERSGSTNNVWVKELDRGTAAKLEGPGGAPAWSPDGKTIVFSGPTGFMRAPADFSALPAPLLPNAVRLATSNVSWSGDGKWIVAARQNADIVAARTDGDTTIRSLIASPSIERQPMLSPDGRWLAYTSDETGRYEVYVRPFPDVNVTRRQVSLNGGFTPVWARDGKELFFADETMMLYSVSVLSGPTFQAGSPQRLFNASAFGALGQQFDNHPDGRRFLMSRPVGLTAQLRDEIVIVENLFDELRRKLPQ